MFAWLKKLTEKEENFVCWFYVLRHEDNAIKFEMKAKRHEIKNIVEAIRKFLNYIGCDGHSDWHFWIDNYWCFLMDEKTPMNFETVKRLSKEYYTYDEMKKNLGDLS